VDLGSAMMVAGTPCERLAMSLSAAR
jgi:hypothetical protein